MFKFFEYLATVFWGWHWDEGLIDMPGESEIAERNDDVICKSKREARERGEHIC